MVTIMVEWDVNYLDRCIFGDNKSGDNLGGEMAAQPSVITI